MNSLVNEYKSATKICTYNIIIIVLINERTLKSYSQTKLWVNTSFSLLGSFAILAKRRSYTVVVLTVIALHGCSKPYCLSLDVYKHSKVQCRVSAWQVFRVVFWHVEKLNFCTAAAALYINWLVGPSICAVWLHTSMLCLRWFVSDSETCSIFLSAYLNHCCLYCRMS